MSYIILIRHGEKEYNNNKGPPGKPRHDPGLKSSLTKRGVGQKILSYFSIYGNPNKIISSPFLRTRQTSQIIKRFLPLEVEINIDKEVEEFLGFQKPVGELADLDIETKKYTQPKLGVEKLDQIQKRILNFYNKINQGNEENILVVTHGILISKLANYFKLDIKHINELEGILIKDNKCYSLN